MKLSNFKLLEVQGVTRMDRKYVAEVNVTTGYLWWKKTEPRKIVKKFAGSWFFADTGKFTPGFDAEELERAWNATPGVGTTD